MKKIFMMKIPLNRGGGSAVCGCFTTANFAHNLLFTGCLVKLEISTVSSRLLRYLVLHSGSGSKLV